ncbi:MAG: recombinase family protein [Acidobacteria bacterium]|nr:recombinase family protein [Acidobacteriota bacterium]
MIGAIYARKSTEQAGVADEQKSVTRQVERARAYAHRKGWTVADACVFVDDGISGAEFAGRPGFLRLMNALKPRSPFQILIMSEESRLGREAIETAYALKQIISAGVRVFFYLEDRERTLDTPTDKIMLSLTAFADELEREKARQRTYDAMARKAQAGHVTGGRVFGYDNVPVMLPGADGQSCKSHVERRVNEAEAGIIRRIFELAAAGYGKKRIAKTLNDEGAPCPRAQQGRPTSWSPSSVFEALARPLYRGEIVWNATKKRDQWGRRHQAPRPEAEWMRLPAEHLRIIDAALWRAAQGRLTESRDAYLSNTGGSAWGRPVGRKPKYLLSGFGTCSACGGSLYVRSRPDGPHRAFSYGCSSYHLRGRTVCENCFEMPMELANRTVLGTLRNELLQPAIARAAVERALAYLRPSSENGNLDNLRSDLAGLDGELGRLSGAIAAGGELPTLLSAIQERERRRAAVATRLHLAEAWSKTTSLDAKRLERELLSELADWRGLLADDAEAARPVLQQLLVGRLAFTPLEAGLHAPVEFRGKASIGGLLAGVVGVQKGTCPGGDATR